MGRKNNDRVSRIGSYAIASSIKDAACFSCTTFNILAPIYKRLSHEVRVLEELHDFLLFLVAEFGKVYFLCFLSSSLFKSCVDIRVCSHFDVFLLAMFQKCDFFNGFVAMLIWVGEQNHNYRESDVKQIWLKRNKRILDWLLCERSSIICLQVLFCL